MRKTTGFAATLAAAGMVFGLAFGTANATPTVTPNAGAAPAAPAAVTPAMPSDQPLVVDKNPVHPGDVINIGLNHGSEGVTYVASEAFTHDPQNDFDPAQGNARVVSDQNGYAKLTATVANVPPGTYTISSRVGGGNGPDLQITVQ